MTKIEQLERGDFAPTRDCVENGHEYSYLGTKENGEDVLRCYSCYPTVFSKFRIFTGVLIISMAIAIGIFIYFQVLKIEQLQITAIQ